MSSLTSNYLLIYQRNLTKVPPRYIFVLAQKTTEKNCCFKKFRTKFYFILQLLLTISPSLSLTSEERGELARKFKYYHKSVRPSEQFNIVDTINGTFFRLLTQMELIETRELDYKAQLGLEMSLFVHFRDDRLQLRDLQEMPIPIPEEFQTWQPRIQLFPMGTTRAIQMQRMINLSPKNGQLTVIHRYSGPLLCDFDQWRVPFERYQCQFWFETDPDERLHLTVVRDLRPNGQMIRIHFEYEQWPWLLLRFHFHSGQWQGAMVSAFLPSLLLICCAILAQWKRRKIQVLVSLGVILALIFIQNGHQQANIVALTNAINLFDFWFAGIFVHLICLLAADLLLPARRLLVFKRTYQWSEDERQNSQQRQRRYISPSISQRKLDGIYSGRRIRATMFSGASSSSLHHHYVSSPKLSHACQMPMPRQRVVARLPAAPIGADSPAQMIRTFSVPPRKLNDVRREQLEPLPLPLSIMGGSAPLSRKRTGLGGLDGQESDARERAIASLLCEMESIRRAEAGGANNQIIRRPMSSEEDEEGFGVGGSSAEIVATPLQIAQQPPSIPPPPPPQPSIGRNIHYGHQQYGDLNPAASQSSDDELDKLDGTGIPRRKRIVLYAILMSLCIFLCTYILLAISALYDWL